MSCAIYSTAGRSVTPSDIRYRPARHLSCVPWRSHERTPCSRSAMMRLVMYWQRSGFIGLSWSCRCAAATNAAAILLLPPNAHDGINGDSSKFRATAVAWASRYYTRRVPGVRPSRSKYRLSRRLPLRSSGPQITCARASPVRVIPFMVCWPPVLRCSFCQHLRVRSLAKAIEPPLQSCAQM